MKKKLVLLSSLASGLVFVPFLALAQNGGTGTTGGSNICSSGGLNPVQGILCTIGGILNTIVPILIALAVVVFVWGVVMYVVASDEEAKKKGKDRMIWGIIGLVVIVAMWGLVSVLTTTFGLNGSVNVQVPTIPL